MKRKKQSGKSVRLSPDASALVERLALETGLSETKLVSALVSSCVWSMAHKQPPQILIDYLAYQRKLVGDKSSAERFLAARRKALGPRPSAPPC